MQKEILKDISKPPNCKKKNTNPKIRQGVQSKQFRPFECWSVTNMRLVHESEREAWDLCTSPFYFTAQSTLTLTSDGGPDGWWLSSPDGSSLLSSLLPLAVGVCTELLEAEPVATGEVCPGEGMGWTESGVGGPLGDDGEGVGLNEVLGYTGDEPGGVRAPLGRVAIFALPEKIKEIEPIIHWNIHSISK